MEAGRSAREEAHRRHQAARRLQRSAEYWDRGAAGESATADVLAGLGPEWVSLHDLRWPGRSQANIDHVLIGPPGIFVVDTKNWSGKVEVVDGKLRQNGRTRDGAVEGARVAAAAIRGLIPGLPAPTPVLCFATTEAVTGRCADVLVYSHANLLEKLSSRPRRLRPDEMAEAHAIIGAPGRRAAYTGKAQRSVVPSKGRRLVRKQRQEMRRQVQSLVAFVVGIAVLLWLTSSPEVLNGLTRAFAQWFVEQSNR